MSIVHFPPRNRFSQQDKASLYRLPGKVSLKGLIGAVTVSQEEAGEVASLLPAGEGPALYGIGIDRGRYHVIDSGDGTTLAEGRSLEEVVSAVAP